SNGIVRHPLESSTEFRKTDLGKHNEDLDHSASCLSASNNSLTLNSTTLESAFYAGSAEDISGPIGLNFVVKQSIASYGSQSLTSNLIDHLKDKRNELIFQWGHLKVRTNFFYFKCQAIPKNKQCN